VRSRADPGNLEPGGIARLLSGPAKYKAALSAAYGAGLRVSVVALKVSDIDSERMLLRIEQGKGPRIALQCFPRCCWSCCAIGIGIARPVWLFPGRDPLLPLTTGIHRSFMPLPIGGDQEASDASHIAPQLCQLTARRENDVRLIRFCSDMPRSIPPRSTRR